MLQKENIEFITTPFGCGNSVLYCNMWNEQTQKSHTLVQMDARNSDALRFRTQTTKFGVSVQRQQVIVERVIWQTSLVTSAHQ